MAAACGGIGQCLACYWGARHAQVAGMGHPLPTEHPLPMGTHPAIERQRCQALGERGGGGRLVAGAADLGGRRGANSGFSPPAFLIPAFLIPACFALHACQADRGRAEARAQAPAGQPDPDAQGARQVEGACARKEGGGDGGRPDAQVRYIRQEVQAVSILPCLPAPQTCPLAACLLAACSRPARGLLAACLRPACGQPCPWPVPAGRIGGSARRGAHAQGIKNISLETLRDLLCVKDKKGLLKEGR
jgi:hypothetical protein